MNTIKRLYHRYPVMTVISSICILLTLLTGFGSIYSTLQWFIFDWQLIGQGQFWRLITPMFLHFSAMGIVFAHLAFNLIWFYYFGTRIESVEGSWSFLLFVILAALISNAVQAHYTLGIFGGLSGVVSAQLGYLFLRPRLSVYPTGIPDNIAYFLIGFIFVAALGLLGPSIGNAAHLSGLGFGLVWACFDHWRKKLA